jgi:hypothetical protein
VKRWKNISPPSADYGWPFSVAEGRPGLVSGETASRRKFHFWPFFPVDRGNGQKQHQTGRETKFYLRLTAFNGSAPDNPRIFPFPDPTMKRQLPALLAATTLILCACAPMGGRGPENGPPGDERGGGGGTSVVANIQERLRLTAEALKLTPTQLPLWDRYQEKIGALMADQMKLESYQARQSALQQISRRVDTVRNRLTAMEDIHESASKLYAALDNKQKQTADQMLISTVPALYSGLGSGGGGSERNSERSGTRGGPGGGGGGGMGGPGGGMGGGFGGM